MRAMRAAAPEIPMPAIHIESIGRKPQLGNSLESRTRGQLFSPAQTIARQHHLHGQQ